MDNPQTAGVNATGAPSTPTVSNQSTTFYLQLFSTAAILLLAAIYVRREKLYPALPVAFLQEESDYGKAKQDWRTRASEVVAHGLSIVRAIPPRLTRLDQIPLGPKIILPNSYANEVKSDSRLSFAKWTSKEFLGHLSGFEGFHRILDTPIFAETVRTKLTQALGKGSERQAGDCQAR
ncbi:hypothetical protein SLS54_004252 [Diplodia seriata]